MDISGESPSGQYQFWDQKITIAEMFTARVIYVQHSHSSCQKLLHCVSKSPDLAAWALCDWLAYCLVKGGFSENKTKKPTKGSLSDGKFFLGLI